MRTFFWQTGPSPSNGARLDIAIYSRPKVRIVFAILDLIFMLAYPGE
jgi:hypothetical protein